MACPLVLISPSLIYQSNKWSECYFRNDCGPVVEDFHCASTIHIFRKSLIQFSLIMVITIKLNHNQRHLKALYNVN